MAPNRKKQSNNSNSKLTRSDDFQRESANLLDGLKNLSVSLQALDATSTVPLSHYRQLPETTLQACELLQNGAQLIHGTSTKYTLLGKIDQSEQIKVMTNDLLKGCQFVGTGCVLIHERSLGSSRAFRRHVKQASRAILETVIQLVQAFADERALQADQETLGAQRTGAVWQACDVVLQKKLPLGNRNAIRRDLFTYMMECQETVDEFQQLIDMGPLLREENEDDANITNNNDATNQTGGGGEAGWINFLEGQDQQYTSAEIAIATSCLTLVKCSRGSVNLTLQACEAVGSQLSQQQQQQQQSANDNNEDNKNGSKSELSEEDKARLEYIEKLYQHACVVGDGMTDFATNLYPPLDLAVLSEQAAKQSTDRIAPLVDLVLDATLSDGTMLDFPQDVTELAGKLKAANAKRRQEALDAISAAAQS